MVVHSSTVPNDRFMAEGHNAKALHMSHCSSVSTKFSLTALAVRLGQFRVLTNA